MNEMDLLEVFYDEMKTRGTSHDQVFLSVDEDMAARLRLRLGHDISLEEAQKIADICLANEWLERTTADPYYNFLSLTKEGLRIILLHEYKKEI